MMFCFQKDGEKHSPEEFVKYRTAMVELGNRRNR